MERHELEQAMESGSLQGVYLFDGTEEYLKQEAMQKLRHALFTQGMGDLNTTNLTSPDTDTLKAACETVPFLEDKRLVIVEEEQALTGRREADEELLEYMKAVPETCVLVYYCRGKADTRRKLAKRIAQCGHAVTFSAMSEAELNAWIRSVFENSGRKCSVDVANELVFMAGNDAMHLRQEMEKLIALTEGRKQIVREDLENITTRNVEYASWELVNAVVDRDRTKALKKLHDMLSNGEASMMILAMLSRQYRQMQMASIMNYEHRNIQEIQKALGIPSFLVNRLMAQVRNLNGNRIRKGVELCKRFELDLKTGRLNEAGAVETLILKLLLMDEADGAGKA